MWDLSLNMMCDLTHKETESRLQILTELGYTHVYLEWHYWDNNEWNKPLPASDLGFNLIKRYRKKLTPISIHIPVIFRSWRIDIPYSLKCLAKIIEIADKFGVKYMTLHPWPGKMNIPTGVPRIKVIRKYQDDLAQVLGEGCCLAERKKLALTIENNYPLDAGGYLSRAEELVSIIRKVRMDNLGICLDTGHANLCGLDPAAFIRRCGKMLFETHFNDNFGSWYARRPSSDLHRPPGIGLINWIAVLAALEEIGFPGPVNFELGMFNARDVFGDLAQITYHNWRALENVYWKMKKT